jgi:hypothetical protein
VVVSTGQGTFEVRFRRDSSEQSLCPAIPLAVPFINFAAEIVSMRDGRIISRINETRSPKSSVDPNRRIQVSSHEPVYSTGYLNADWNDNPIRDDGTYKYVSSWSEKNAFCDQIAFALKGWAGEVESHLMVELKQTATEIFNKTLDPLYQ